MRVLVSEANPVFILYHSDPKIGVDSESGSDGGSGGFSDSDSGGDGNSGCYGDSGGVVLVIFVVIVIVLGIVVVIVLMIVIVTVVEVVIVRLTV